MTLVRALGVVGTGEIAAAVVDGLCGGSGRPPDVHLSPRNREVARALATRHPTVHVCADNQEVVDHAGIVLLAVRPQVVGEVLAELRVPAGRVVVSAVAGLSHATLRRALGDAVPVVRAIPLPAVRRRQGVTALHPAHPEAQELFGRLGRTLVVDDEDALTATQAATATLSTYVHLVATIATWLTAQGVGRHEAEAYVRAMFHGVDLASPTQTLAELAGGYETPGGINEQLRRTWFAEPSRAALGAALDDVRDRLAGVSPTPPPVLGR